MSVTGAHINCLVSVPRVCPVEFSETLNNKVGRRGILTKQNK